MTSVRNQVVDALVTAIQAVDGTGSYTHALAVVERKSANRLNEHELPAVFVAEGEEAYDEATSPEPALVRRLQVFVEATLRVDVATADAASDVAELLADLERAIKADETLGGLAIETNLVRNAPIADDERGPRAGLDLELELVYRAKHDDPATRV